jgi:hypothetical protein
MGLTELKVWNCEGGAKRCGYHHRPIVRRQDESH